MTTDSADRLTATDVLLTLLWLGGKIAMPSWRTFFQSYEGWEYQNGLRHHVHRLEKNQLIQRCPQADAVCYQLTALGKLRALGGDPLRRWNRPWDGKWRMIVFDIPADDRRTRMYLLRWLHQNNFGCLQDSSWITPDPIDAIDTALKGFGRNVESLIWLEARQLGQADPAAIVKGAWPIQRLLAGYDRYLRFSATAESRLRQKATTLQDVVNLGREEKSLWESAAALDPLLPRDLWPEGYSGERAWTTRRRSLSAMAKTLQRIQP